MCLLTGVRGFAELWNRRQHRLFARLHRSANGHRKHTATFAGTGWRHATSEHLSRRVWPRYHVVINGRCTSKSFLRTRNVAISVGNNVLPCDRKSKIFRPVCGKESFHSQIPDTKILSECIFRLLGKHYISFNSSKILSVLFRVFAEDRYQWNGLRCQQINWQPRDHCSNSVAWSAWM